MIRGLFSNWIVLALISSITTAILIRASKEALGSFDSAVIMAVRVIGIGILTIPLALYALSKSGATDQFLKAVNSSWHVMAIIAFFGAASWYSFYLALDAAGKDGDAAVTAINYTSVAGVMVLLMLQNGYMPSIQNWIGVALVAIGAYLTSMR